MNIHNFKLFSLQDTKDFAKHLQKVIIPGFVIALSGNLGSGKTTFIRQILLSLGIQGTVKSPTFTIVEPYQINDIEIFHFDLYRFNDDHEWIDAGFYEYFHERSICFIEWPEKAMHLFPKVDLHLKLKYEDSNSEVRDLTIEALSNQGNICLTQLIQSVENS